MRRAAQLGAHCAGADPTTVGVLESYGRNLGIAFQIADDLLDVLGDEATTGKLLGTDLDQLKPTLPLIHVLEQVPSAERDSVMSVLQGDRSQRKARLRP